MAEELTCRSPLMHPQSSVEQYLEEIQSLAALTGHVMLSHSDCPEKAETGLYFVQERIERLADALMHSLPAEVINFEPATESIADLVAQLTKGNR